MHRHTQDLQSSRPHTEPEKLECFHASFFPFCPFCWPSLFLPFSRHIFAISSPSKSALFCRAKGTVQSLGRGSSGMDLPTEFGKEIPSRNLREKRSGKAGIPESALQSPNTAMFGRLIFIHLQCCEVLPFCSFQRQRCIKILCPKGREFYTPLALKTAKRQHLAALEVYKNQSPNVGPPRKWAPKSQVNGLKRPEKCMQKMLQNRTFRTI